MSDGKTCTHCGGSGTEPDSVALAHRALMLAITNAASLQSPDRNALKAAADELLIAAGLELRSQRDRVTAVEGALRDMLRYPSENGPGTATIFQVSHEDVRNWRAILEGTRRTCSEAATDA